ncbi:MAG TPA: hypothetical protein VF138_07895 [Caulobacteraceae bacterium]
MIKLTRNLMAATAAISTLGALAVPAAASAQTYAYGQPAPYYDACQRSTVNRSTIGGLTGAAIGAAVGSKMAARGVRTEGAVLGGLLGAALGVKVGRDSAACSRGYAAPYAAAPARTYQYAPSPYNSQPYGH